MYKHGHEAIPLDLKNDLDKMLKKQLVDRIETKENVKGRPKQYKLFVIDLYCGLFTKKNGMNLEVYLKEKPSDQSRKNQTT